MMLTRLLSIHERWNLAFAISLIFLLSGCGLAIGQECGNGLVEPSEQCDDNNTISGDGCNNDTCGVEPHYNCVAHNLMSPSVCTLALLDLDKNNHTTLDNSVEFFDVFTPVFLVDPDSLEILVQTTNWTYLDVVLLEGDSSSIFEQVELDTSLSLSLSRRPLSPSDYSSGINGRSFKSGLRILIEMSELTQNELLELLQAVTYTPNQLPSDFLPRYVCLVAEDVTLNTTACVTLHYIGHNTNPPLITYTSSGVATFIEGYREAVPIIIGNITVTDDDHPTRYLIQSASARIIGFTEGIREQLSLHNVSGLTGIIYSFNSTSGTLSISGAATTEVYSYLLQNLAYFNNMSQPIHSRQIDIIVADDNFTSDAISIQVNVMNTNDRPLVSLDGDAPIITMLARNYTEGSGAVPIVNNVTVIDIDPNAMIIRAIVVLNNSVDGSQELINVTDRAGLDLYTTDPPHYLELSGAASPTNYTRALRTLIYQHLSANPGNPSLQSRYIEFTVEDTNNATSDVSILTLDVVPVNDPPLLELAGGASEEQFSYTEDDPPINIGANIALNDVDSDIQSVSLSLTNLLDGDQDSIDFDVDLLLFASINITSISNGTSREIVLYGTGSASTYTEILRSLSYRNLYTNNSVTDGRRIISISATDTMSLGSVETITLLVDAAERNDGPSIDFGNGNDQGFTVVYSENEPDVEIGSTHLITITDEEGDSIASMDIELVATNGALDEGDTLFVRATSEFEFVLHPNTVITTTRINVSSLSTDEAYVDILRSLIYFNTDDEPTLYVNGSKLIREIVIRITDSANNSATNVVRLNMVIMPINDKTPRIIINSFPKCTQDVRHIVQRRSTIIETHHRKRSTRSTSVMRNFAQNAAPKVDGLQPYFVERANKTCLLQLVVHFNTDTNIPVVGVQREMNSLMTFAPASLAKTPHSGYWKDYRTLIIVFEECIPWEREQSRRRPLYVVFYDPKGSCSWDSPCNKGVCYYNRTGCPVFGYHRVNMSVTEGNSSTSNSTEDCTTPGHTSSVPVYAFTCVLLVALVTVTSYHCWKKNRPGGVREDIEEEMKEKRIPPAPSHVIDIKVPLTTSKSSSTHPESAEDEKLLLQNEESDPMLTVETCSHSVTGSGNLDANERVQTYSHDERSLANKSGDKENPSDREDGQKKTCMTDVGVSKREGKGGEDKEGQKNCSISPRVQSTSHTPQSNRNGTQKTLLH